MTTAKLISLIITCCFAITLTYFIAPNLFAFDIKLPTFFQAEGGKKSRAKSNVKSNLKKRVDVDHAPKVIDSYKGVSVFYNGKTSNVYGRHMTKDGYNLGLKYQCVEYVKRFYYEHYNHKMPNPYGHAKELFDTRIQDGGYNKDRGLNQYRNNGNFKPRPGAIMVFGQTPFNKYGHVVIITDVGSDYVEIIQQNPGPDYDSRGTYKLTQSNGKWRIHDPYIIGWLSKNG